MTDFVWARPSGTGSRASHRATFRVSTKGFDPARMERCEYCGCNIHRCGCEDALSFEQVRDNPTLLAR